MKKILIIDDDKTFRVILKEVLIKEGYHLLEAPSGEKGLEIVKSEHPDLVITDFQMPGLSGLEVLQAIIKMKTGIPVIMITGFSDTENIIKAIQMGAFDYLEKPINHSVLKTAIKVALNSANLSSNLDMVVNEEAFSSNVSEENILVGNTPPMKEVFKKIGCISLNKVNVLILGETGTGKELIARLIHYTGVTKDQPLVTVNCSALAESLLESELFGHVKGSFTGAIRDKKGKFELAGEGSILLDEISEISLNTQVKLLRVIQELEFEKVGGEATIPMKARIIAASNRNLEELIKEGKFREDLYYRLKVFTIQIPPLRDRKEDIGGLVIHFLRKLNKKFNKNVVKIGEGVIDMLKEHDWYGNVRELENTLLQAIVISKSDVLQKENIMLNFRNPSENGDGEKMPNLKSLADVEAYHIKKILDQMKWNRVESSRILDISRPTLNAKIEKYHLEQE
jgi:two-component system response regulator AtoC